MAWGRAGRQGRLARMRKHPVLAVLVWLVSLALAIPPVLLVDSVVAAGRALAATYSAGMAKYQQGDLPGAESDLTKALAKKQSRAERAKTLKLLGIVQYTMGKKPAAGSSFKQALALDSKLTVSPSEALDPGVIPYFNSMKGGGAKPAAPKPAPQPKPAPASAPPAPVAAAAGSAKAVKKTLLKVLSNVPGASVSMDGIIAGQVNSLINVEPGTVSLEVSAAGYITRRISVTVVKNQETSITVNLSKPQPKVKPKPKPKPQPKPIAKATPGAGGKPTGGGKPGKAYAPKPADDMFAEADAGAGAGGPPAAMAPPGGPDLGTQFQMDTAGGGGYGAPPGYGAPMGYPYAQPAPMYYPPPPMYYAPPAMAAPPPPPPPPVDPYGGGAPADPYAAPADPYAAPGAPADPAGGDPAPESGGGGGGGDDDRNLLITLLPFGAGQFQNKNYLLGLAFLGAEAGALFYWRMETQAAATGKEEADAWILANCRSTGATLTTQSGSYSKEDCQAYQANAQTYVDTKNRNAMIGLAAFGGLWAAGAIEAMLSDGPGKKAKKKPKKRKYRRFSLDAPHSAPDDGELDGPRRPELEFAWTVGLLPAYSGDPAATAVPGVGLDLKWDF